MTTQASPPAASGRAEYLRQIAGGMSAWLKFLGIINMLLGAVLAVSLIGLLVAWLPIWMGILLYQAGERSNSVLENGSGNDLTTMLEKLKMYFIMSSVIGMLILAFSIGLAILLIILLRMSPGELQGLMQYVF